jgi:hypothetical protein
LSSSVASSRAKTTSHCPIFSGPKPFGR